MKCFGDKTATRSLPPGPCDGRTARRASVLILVVALLVLMALIGTAFIVTARTDRVAAKQHTDNAQADMAVQSTVNLVGAELVADLFDPSGAPQFNFAKAFRPTTEEGGDVGTFENWDGYFGDTVIGSRVPVLLNPTRPPTSIYPSTPDTPLFPYDPGGVNPPVWTALGRTPELPVNQEADWSGDPTIDGGRSGAIHYAPTARPFLGDPLWPYLQVYYEGAPWDYNPDTPEIDAVPAGDADGDGIADGFLWKLPMGPMNGLTYYASFRVVDNNSAVNVNTALSRNADFDGKLQAVPAPSFFTGRVGIAEMLRTYVPGGSLNTLGHEFLKLNTYRFNGGTTPAVAGVRGQSGLLSTPFDDLGSARRDFNFLTVGDALESQLGRRIGNPGGAFGPRKYRPFTLADSMALGYRFCLADATTSHSAIESVLDESLFYFADASGKRQPVPGTPYRADETQRWMERFQYDLERAGKPGTFRDLRALLVARNPVSDQEPARFSAQDLNGDGYRNDTPTAVPAGVFPLAGGAMDVDSDTIRPFEGVAPYVMAGGGVRTRAVPTVSINTASFAELWRGFWGVMAPWERNTNSPLMASPGRRELNPFFGSRFGPQDVVPLPPDQEDAEEPDPTRTPMPRPMGFEPGAFDPIHERNVNLMFRSSIRDVRKPKNFAPARFSAGAQMLLRSALAAVNAEDLRDPDDDVSSHLIRLVVRRVEFLSETEEKVAVRVYGTERQPFITEVYVNTDDRASDAGGVANPKGYVAIELHNPYDADITLGGAGAADGWSVGLINRSHQAAGVPVPPGVPAKPRLKVLNLDGTESPPWRFPAGTVVPAHGYLVLENLDPAGGDSLAAKHRPAAARAGGLGETSAPGAAGAATPRTVFVPGLHRVLADPSVPANAGGEFVLLRTRKADGTSGKQTGPGGYDETANLSDLIPVDQFDFTGALLAAPPPPGRLPSYTALHYVRANDRSASPSGAWKFVYPGRYNGRLVQQRQQGTVQAQFGPDPADTFKSDPFDMDGPAKALAARVPLVLLGAADAAAAPGQGSFPIQIAGPGFGGPSRLAATGNVFPFGLFAREADLLQIPFIGAYTVYAGAAPGRELYEMNSLPMDSVFAEDSDTSDDDDGTGNAADDREQIGRFCPVRVVVAPDVFPPPPRVDDFVGPSPGPSPAPHPPYGRSGYPAPFESDTVAGSPTYRYRYRWATDLFEHFSVHSPHNDFLPSVAPSLYKTAAGAISPPPVAVSNSGGVAGNSDPLDRPDPVTGKPDATNDYDEDLQPVDGLINVNTAPWKVLAALPMVLNGAGFVDADRNAELAKAIVYFRDVDDGYRASANDKRLYPHGPFKTLFELNEVIDTRPAGIRKFPGPGRNYGFRNAYGTLDFSPGSTEPGPLQGDLANDAAGQGDGVRGDWEEHFLTLNRVSNLITTRSDSFTCYVFVMGVRNDGTPLAEVKVKRRVAFIADRSGVRPLRPVLRTSLFGAE